MTAPANTTLIDASTAPKALTLLIRSVRLEAEDVITISLEDAEGHDLPEWQPGAHLDVELPSGLRRQYSLCGSPQDRSTFTLAVLKERNSRGGSRELHETAIIGHIVRATLRNHFELVPSERYLFIGGGIGITPLLPMVRHVGDAAPWRLFYGGRTLRSMAFTEDLLTIGGNSVELRTREAGGLRPIDDIVSTADAKTAIYCCGPNTLIQAVQEAHARLAPEADLHVERFSASARAVTAPTATGDRPVELELRRTGATIQVRPDQTLLNAIRTLVPSTPFSCSEGYCGSCEVTVVSGTPDHRDEILTPNERESSRTMFPCVSRALSARLVLDI
ncbi:PDR/VanB family oxidoreductase [Streptomyces chartreusis]|uniref:PDR/VanB family oxidoreductase n=1 Tax=Streptomyces chartreusis TaxID=1969 RepID=UPI002F910F54|nr:PDR/VanB family oxidoreductase [Streptomyces chartreusis]WTA33530.1 PDR/VanB family oxidoreductase [Streptomyces chartreusis]